MQPFDCDQQSPDAGHRRTDHEASAHSCARVMRVFISSTFHDMHAERDELVKRIFPQLRKLCEQRGVTWGEVDLRWGITQEQAEAGQVLPICLEEIHRCRPYFLGILGERYGWVPDDLPQALIDEQPWLAEHQQCSITELEIIHGVLNNPEMASHAYFYFRDPAYVETLPAERRPFFRETPAKETIARYGLDIARQRADDRRNKLQALKDRILASGFPVRRSFPDPQALGALVFDDLRTLIDQQFPLEEQPGPLEREAAAHEAFAASRRRIYVSRPSDFEQLDAHARGTGLPLILLGEAGSGKSALLANWAQHYHKQHPHAKLLSHYVGASPSSSDWRAMLQRLMGELKGWFTIEAEIPNEPDDLRMAFSDWLAMAADEGPLILILDGLSQLEDREGARDLVWLPTQLPENVRLILSSVPDQALQALETRGIQRLRVKPIETEARARLVRAYLQQFRKALSPAQTDRVIGAPQTGNPLYLRVLLDELRIVGAYARLDAQIEHYLDAKNVEALYAKLLERYEQDYERDRPGLVRDCMSLIWAARRGLSEVELLEILGTEDGPLPSAYWAPLHLAAESMLENRGGLITFNHNQLRRAVQQEYLESIESQHAVHLQLSRYFERQDHGHRRMEELPWQLAQAEAWESLHALLGDLPTLAALNQAAAFDVRSYWSLLETHSTYRMLDSYRELIQTPQQFQEHAWDMALLLSTSGYPEASLKIGNFLLERFRESDEWGLYTASLGSQANLLYKRGRLDQALALHRQEERLCRDLGLQGGLAICLVNQAGIFFDRGESVAAMDLYRQAEKIFYQQESSEQGPVRRAYKRGRAKSLTGQANVLSARGDLQGALALHYESERLCRELGHQDELVVSLTNQGNTLFIAGRLDEAWALYTESEMISRETGNKQWLANAISNQANVLYKRGELDQALVRYTQAERIFREIEDKIGLGISLQNQAEIFAEQGDNERALSCYQEIESLCREIGSKAGLQGSLSNHAYLLYTRGELIKALSLQQENEALCRELGQPRELVKSLILQAAILGLHRQQPQEAAPKVEEAYQLALECGDSTLVKQVMTIQAEINNLL